MARPVYIRPEADQDVEEIRAHLRREQPRAAVKFDAHWTRVLVQLQSMPYLGGRVWRTVRCLRIRGFRYVAYYRVRRHRVEVFAVVHGSRSPSVWKARL